VLVDIAASKPNDERVSGSPLAVNEALLESLIGQMVTTSDALGEEIDSGAGLRILVNRAREIGNARYAALSTFDEHGRVERFIYEGFDERLAAMLGSPPTGRGLLGRLAEHREPLRLDDVRTHSSFTGWPHGHPEMAAFLGVPLRAAGATIGSLYLARDEGEPGFSRLDELAVSMLALQASGVVAMLLNQEREQRVALLEERQRIAHDLHDGIIQTLYAIGLQMNARVERPDVPEDARTELAGELELINQVIAEIREYIAALEQSMPAERPDLSRDLAHILRVIVPESIETVLNISAASLQEFSSREIEDLIYIAREALSNAVRHGSPTRLAVDLRETPSEIALTIQDNGVGFDLASAHAGLGTITMRTRAERLGGTLLTMSIPGMGTTVRVARPRFDESP
jgi:signal transduction histidine kinase